MYTYSQRNGVLTRGSAYLGTGFSGRDEGYNNPDLEAEHDVGPIPRGKWMIGAPITHPELGSLAMPLAPQSGVNPFGRTGFYMHGWSVDPAKKLESSHGCICMAHPVRVGIAASLTEDNQLEVV